MKIKVVIFVSVLVALVGLAIFLWWPSEKEKIPEDAQPEMIKVEDEVSVPPSPEQPATQTIVLSSLDGAHNAFKNVEGEVPIGWQAAAVTSIEAINIFDPTKSGNELEQSQIFIRHFEASDFLTLDTVLIHSSEPATINGRPAVIYDIEKFAEVPDFPDQPSWRNGRHFVTDIRISDENPSEFIVIARNPDLSEAQFESFLQSLGFDGESTSSSLVPPTANFFSSITLKPFGIFITPGNSPVQPERFTGFHTGVDAELPADTIVSSIAQGSVLRSEFVSGYGGMVAIEHTLSGQRVVGVYGHLDPKSMISLGSTVGPGQQIGVLGKTHSAETDGARAHLHLSLYRGPGIDIRGYVQNESALSNWLDPVEALKSV